MSCSEMVIPKVDAVGQEGQSPVDKSRSDGILAFLGLLRTKAHEGQEHHGVTNNASDIGHLVHDPKPLVHQPMKTK